jgi:uncharacterized protein DUF4349
MKTNAGPPARRAGLRATLLIAAAAMSGSGLLLAGCSSGSGSTASASAASGGSAASGESAASAGSAPSAAASGGQGVAGPAPDTRAPGATTARLVQPAQSIIYTASLTIRAADVRASAALATGIAAADGGYVASEQDLLSRLPGQSTVSLRLKIPVASYPAVLRQLSGKLGKQLSLTQQAEDVTGQVADVSSRVTSAKAAITQLRALLRRAGSVGGLLSVQDEINSQEASLESLQSQQRALAGETSYATVSVQLLSQHKAVVHHHARNKHGFAAGLSSGWHGLRAATAWLLTVAGAVLPFAAVLAVLAAGGWFTWRRIKVRRRSRPAPAA